MARDELEPMLPQLVEALSAAEWRAVDVARATATSRHVYSQQAFALLRPDQAKRIKAFRMRLMGFAEVLNHYRQEFGVEEVSEKKISTAASKAAETGDQKAIHEAMVAALTPPQRAKWIEYMALAEAPAALYDEAAGLLWAERGKGYVPRQKHVPRNTKSPAGSTPKP